MKCSDCNHVVRPVVAVDIDGTLAEYHVAVTKFSARYYNRPVPTFPYTGSEPFRDYLELTQAEHRAMKLAYRQSGAKRWQRPYPGAATFTMFVRSLGAELWVATTRPWQRLDNIDPDTREWLHRNKIEIDGLLFGDDKYQQLVDAVGAERVVAVVDDLSEQFGVAQELGLSPIQVARDHNSAPSAMRTPRHLLGEMTDMIETRVETWRAING